MSIIQDRFMTRKLKVCLSYEKSKMTELNCIVTEHVEKETLKAIYAKNYIQR